MGFNEIKGEEYIYILTLFYTYGMLIAVMMGIAFDEYK